MNFNFAKFPNFFKKTMLLNVAQEDAMQPVVGRKKRGPYKKKQKDAVPVLLAKDINIFEENKSALTKMPKTQSAYNRTLKLFTEFCEVDWDSTSIGALSAFPAALLTDEKIASFLFARGQLSGKTLSIQKGIMAAFASACKHHGVPNVYDQMHVYPETHKVLGDFSTDQKIHPHYPVHASVLTLPQMAAILQLVPENNEQILNMAIHAWETYTACRSKTTHALCSCDIEMVGHTTKDPRHLCAIVSTIKNDMKGTGPIENRMFALGCTCAQLLSTTAAGNRIFLRDVKKDPMVLCQSPMCAMWPVLRYMLLIPDAFGKIQQTQQLCQNAGKAESVELPRKLKFIRALTSMITSKTGDREFTCNPLGLNKISEAFAFVNDLLPSEKRSEHVTGHTGRRTYATNGMKVTGDVVAMCKATKHKDINTFGKVYVEPDTTMLMKGGLALQGAVSKRMREDENDENGSITDHASPRGRVDVNSKTGFGERSATKSRSEGGRSATKIWSKISDSPRRGPLSYISQLPRKLERTYSPEGKPKVRSSFEDKKKVIIDLVSSTESDIAILEIQLELAKKQKVLKEAKDEVMCLGVTGFSYAEGMFDTSDEEEGGDEGEGGSGGNEGEGCDEVASSDGVSDGSIEMSQISSRRR